MMQYNLTEEQSTKFYNDLKDAIALVDELHASAITVFEGWYQDYLNNHHSMFGFKPMSIEKFGKKITLTKQIYISESLDGRILTNLDGWGANLRPKTITKLTKNDYMDILGELNLVSAACMASVYKHREYNIWTSIVGKMEKYMQVPYTIDQEWLDVLESLNNDTTYYKNIMKVYK